MVVDLTETGHRVPISREDFRSLFRKHPGAVCVITVSSPAGVAGFTATSVVSVSAEPPMLAFSIARGSSAWAAMASADRITVHFLAREHSPLAVRFATPSIDRFDGVEWSHTPAHGVLLHDVQTWATGTVASFAASEASALVCVRIDGSQAAEDHDALLYRDRTYAQVDALSVD